MKTNHNLTQLWKAGRCHAARLAYRLGLSDKYCFPPNFVWGTGTSAYQVEGAHDQDGKGESIWDRFCRSPGNVKNGDTGNIACDQYHRFAQDMELCRRLNLGAYRFSIAWPRVQPLGRGALNEKGMSYYDRLIDELLALGIEPVITLYHWDLPQALQDDLGGFAHRDTVQHFADYTEAMVHRYSDRVKFWTTLNEPWCSSFLGHQTGYHAPGIKDPLIAAQVAHNLLLCHGAGTIAARAAARQKLDLGIVLNLTISEALNPADAHLADKAFARDCGFYLEPLLRGKYSQAALAGIKDFKEQDLRLINQPMDYLGINYYARSLVSSTGKTHPVPGAEYTQMGWEVHPQALRRLLNRIRKDYPEVPPLYVTENGAAYEDLVTQAGRINDTKRLEYLRRHIEQVALAIEDGVDVRGYFAWSLLDNFEWAEGYDRRFGIVHVDFATQERRIKDSGLWYAETARSNKIVLPRNL
ncbi:MAG TPA: GH1 family beta-glucosidase [Candidatus Obscuribacter sp.]|nr:GH1 family beta-glucosidase [Candidatus Obscuribacter sp.]